MNNRDLPDGFRMTELGPPPEGWEATKISGLIQNITSGDWGEDGPLEGQVRCYVLRGTDFPRAERGDFSGIPQRYIKKTSLAKRQLVANDLLVEMSGGSKDQPTGRIMLVAKALLDSQAMPVVFSNFVKRLSLVDGVIPAFFCLYWKYLYKMGATRVYEKRTTGIRNFKLDDFLGNQYIPLPPLPEQRAIAHVLRTVQRAKEATERVIAAARELKKSLMRHLFTYGPVPVNQVDGVRLKETEIGSVPEGWEVVRLGELVNRSEQVDPRRAPNRMVRYVDVSSIERETLQIVGYLQFKGDKAPSRARKLIKTDDVIFATVRPYLKRVAMVPSELDGQLCSTAFCVLRAKSDIVEPRFLFYTTSSDRFVAAVAEHQRGSSYPAVTDSDVKRTAIPLPPLPEQRAIADMLRAVDRKIQAEEQRKAALDALFKTLLHHLMTGKVRVRNAPTEPGG